MYSTTKQYRLPNQDYSADGYYFITICTQGRKHIFGDIRKKLVCLTDIGTKVWQTWNSIPQHFYFIILDEFIVMPDHIHGIIKINNGTRNRVGRNGQLTVPTKGFYLQPQKNSLSIVVRTMKGVVTKWCRENTDLNVIWQPRFHDRVIRTKHELNAVRKYIKNNPKNWQKK